MPFTKNGSIPQSLENFVSHIRKFSNNDQETSNWIEVSEKPTAPEGKEVVWWSPPGWVIRDPKPADEEGFVWKWNQTSEEWIKYSLNQSNVIIT